jgi:hypothetical protein
MRIILTQGLGQSDIRELNESSESRKAIRRIRRIRRQAISRFGFATPGWDLAFGI